MSELIEQDNSAVTPYTPETPKNRALSVFQETGLLPKHASSNTISLYDLIPKYTRTGNEKAIVSSDKESQRIYDFSFEGRNYIIVVTAARIPKKDGTIEYHFPHTREELTEDVLRHLLTANRQMGFFEENVGVQFTIYKIKSELEKYNKTKSIAQIRQSLKILRRATLAIYRADAYKNGAGDSMFEGPYFSDATVVDPQDYFARGTETDIKGLVKFHNMVSMGISEMDFRLLRYDICMKYKSDVARWLHKRISHRHESINPATPYQIKLSTIFNDGNWKWQERVDKNLNKFTNAIREMCSPGNDQTGKPLPPMLNINKPYELKPIHDQNETLVDYKINLYLSKAFVDHIAMSKEIHENYALSQNNYEDNTFAQLPEESKHGYKILLEHRVRAKIAERLSLEHTLQEIEAAISWVDQYLKRKSMTHKNDTHNVAGFIYKTLTEGWYKDEGDAEVTIFTTNAIDPNDYEGDLKVFVKEVVCTLTQAEQEQFKLRGVEAVRIKELWEDFLEDVS